jgi:hypothetical protein
VKIIKASRSLKKKVDIKINQNAKHTFYSKEDTPPAHHLRM